MDFIFALATSKSISALHVHRLSGNGVLNSLLPYLYLPHNKKSANFSQSKLSKNFNCYLIIKNKKGDIIDDVILSFFPNPKSYTGEDVVEISTHGNPLISLHLHSFFRSLGLRDAKAGEFTSRAVLNGKLDLAQAEGINQLIHAETMGGIELARNNVEGILSKETLDIRAQIIELLAYLEAHIDFAPDEVGSYEPQNLIPKINAVKQKLTNLFASYENGIKIREGLKVVLCGKPNAGKSSLYNALLKNDRAIVTSIAGTTRDVLEDKFLIENKEFVLLDTAGIRDTQDEVEQIGISKTFLNVNKSDIICYLISAPNLNKENYREEIKKECEEFMSQIQFNSRRQKLIVALNKWDLISEEEKKIFGMDPAVSPVGSPRDGTLSSMNSPRDGNISSINNLPFISISQHDFEELKNKLLNFYEETFEKNNLKNSPMLISQRQKDKVEGALKYMEDAHRLCEAQDFPEKVASLIHSAQILCEEIVGEISLDNVFEKIFSSFCIGK